VAGGKVEDAWIAGVHRLEPLFDAAHMLLRSEDRINSRGVGCCMQQLKGVWFAACYPTIWSIVV
jgi:hypothetical protein